MKEIETEPWICSNCGYKINAMTATSDNAVPSEGSITICLNCAAVYELDWQLRPRPSKLLNPIIVLAQLEIIKRGRIK
jgi:hypothetical protein